jgi:hypothetical protein
MEKQLIPARGQATYKIGQKYSVPGKKDVPKELQAAVTKTESPKDPY